MCIVGGSEEESPRRIPTYSLEDHLEVPEQMDRRLDNCHVDEVAPIVNRSAEIVNADDEAEAYEQ
jgi:hypothetical protein